MGFKAISNPAPGAEQQDWEPPQGETFWPRDAEQSPQGKGEWEQTARIAPLWADTGWAPGTGPYDPFENLPSLLPDDPQLKPE